MEWQHPEALYLILPLCGAWFALVWYSSQRRRVARQTFAAKTMWSRIFPDESAVRSWSKLVLQELAIIAGLAALAQPRFGLHHEQIIPRGSDLYVLIDVSRSMLADDVQPTRLARAKADVSSLINRLSGDRVGLIAFAGQAVVKCPLTADYDSFRRALEELDTDSAPRGGTAIGDAIRKAIEVFRAKSERDQAVLLITDGEDQLSYPLEAAATAAERHVTIFTIGLGDADRGARVPQKSDSHSFVEYQGEQIWSKLDGNLLQQIALKTSGVYVPAGTRSYDLGELYTNYLQGRRGSETASQDRIRRTERFQIFLGLSLLLLLIDLCIGRFGRPALFSNEGDNATSIPASGTNRSASRRPSLSVKTGLLLMGFFAGATNACHAVEPAVQVRDGMRLFAEEKFDEALEKFALANQELDKQKATAASAIAAFDEACAAHRKGDIDRARECYQRAGLSLDRSIATAAHFNLGTLAAEQARQLCGDQPEAVPTEKRQAILDQLSQAIAAYRHCLELRPDDSASRRNLELVRQWIKYYSDRWRAYDRQKRRDESNLIQFLEFLIQSQTTLRKTVDDLSDTATSDAFAESKVAQDELREEIPTLRGKIDDELRPPADPSAPAAQTSTKEIDEGISLLQGWADTAGSRMAAAGRHLGARDAGKSTKEQQTAIEELEKIWEAVIPFHPLLAAELSAQTSIARTLSPRGDRDERAGENADPTSEPADPLDLLNTSDPVTSPATTSDPKSVAEKFFIEDFSQLEEKQLQVLKRARLLGPKAEAELSRVEESTAAGTAAGASTEKPGQAGEHPASAQVDPEQLKAGYRKAMELAPQAVEQMDAAVQSLRQKDPASAAQQAETARKILEEIQQAQPKNPQQQNPDDQEQKNKDEDEQEQNNKNEQKKPGEQKKDHDSGGTGAEKKERPDQGTQQEPVSNDRIEDALRKVRERQKDKRERDRKLHARFLERAPVDKDW
ncbi:VWA domain-containing protein [Schlesneria paludicola]|uniref:VWA domain-containing protein n=1 Tax=Schlesneria paludicola TaxID=360056 RepID=UPI00029ADA90|nr:VWA domain-containing protein [Schlesneria paludicola]